MSLRKAILALALIGSTAAPARADVGLGLIVGEPTALDLKLGFDRVSALDLAFGIDRAWDAYGYYFHATYLATLAVARGNSVNVPVRLGIGGAVFWGDTHFDGFALGVRAPIELALRFRRAPIEIYLELALMLVVVDPAPSYVYLQGQGGLGLRVYF